MSEQTIRIAVTGANGRMGRALVQSISDRADCKLTGALEHAGSSALGRDAGDASGIRTGVTISCDAAAVIAGCDVLIDFSRPEASLAYLALCAGTGVDMVIGTTGFDDAGKAAIAAAAEKIAVVFSPNFSIGVNVTFALLQQAAKILNSGYDVEIIEAHHRHKVDAPSGTALRMGEVVAEALGRDLKTCAVYGREGHTGARDPESIGFSVVRGGDIVGDHTVMFAADGERVEITHKASGRSAFSSGAVQAAVWLNGHKKGLFSMQDVLAL